VNPAARFRFGPLAPSRWGALAAGCAALVAMGSPVRAADGTWNVNASGGRFITSTDGGGLYKVGTSGAAAVAVLSGLAGFLAA